MKRRFLFVILVLCLVLSSFPIRVFALDEEMAVPEDNFTEPQTVPKIWDGSIADSYAGGTGSSGSPYLIATAEQLARVAQQTNNGIESGKYYKLLDDIYLNDISSVDNWEISPPQNTWIPIGNSSNQFASHFDGAGHTVFGLYISSEESFQGLLGYVPQDITISNVGVEKSYVKGLDNIGAILGYCSGNISNCHSDSAVFGRNCVGGIVGGMGNRHSWAGDYEVNIRNCHNTGKIQGQQYVGGITGKANFGYIFDSYNTADISGTNWVGGVGGYAIRATSCWNAGKIVGSNYVGGIFGEGGYFGDKSAEITTSFNAGSISGNSYVGGIYGISHVHSSLYPCYITNCYNAGDVAGTGDYIGGITGQAAIHNTGGGFFGANMCHYTNCYNIGSCTFGTGSNCGAIFNVGCASANNVFYKRNSCGLSYVNNFSNYVKEKSSIEMLRKDFLSTLNGSSSTWKNDLEGINGGFPILASIDYRPFKLSGVSIEMPSLWCELAIMDSESYEPLSDVSIFDDTTDTLLGYVETDGHFVLPGPGSIFAKDLPISFYKSGYKKFTCFYSDLDIGDTYEERSTNSIYMEKESEQSPSTEEKALIGDHIDFARTRYKEVTEKYGFYTTVWDRLSGDDGAGKHLWAFYFLNLVGDVGELASFELDDLTIWMNWYDAFMSDLVLDLTGNEKNTTFDNTAFKIYNKVYKEVKNDLVDAVVELVYGEAKDKSYQEIWDEANSSITKLLNGKDKLNDTEKIFIDNALRNLCDSELWYDIFEGLDAASTLISAGSDIVDFIANITNAYIVAESAALVNEDIYNVLYLSAQELEMMNPSYSKWFVKAIDKYYKMATDRNAITKHLIDNALIDVGKITYKSGVKDVIKECTYKAISEYLSIPLANLKFYIALYKAAFKLLSFAIKLEDCGEQYFIMNYVAPVEKNMETTVKVFGENLISSPSVDNSNRFETAYGMLRYTNKYLYDAVYNFAVHANNKSDMEAATILKHMWTLADCHNKVIGNRSKYISIACPTDVYLYNASGELVVAIINDVLETYTDPYVTVMNYDGEKSLMYSNNDDYHIRIVAREAGMMDYSIAEIDGDDTTRYSEFYDIELNAGQEFSGDIPKGFGIADVEYVLLTNAETIEADYDSDRELSCGQAGHTWEEWVIEIEPTNNSFGLKKRLCPVCGKIESLSIEPTASTHTITLESNGGTLSVPFLQTDVDGKLISLSTPTRPGYTFLGWFTAPTGGTQVTADTVFTQDTTIYAHWQKYSSGGGTDDGQPTVTYYSVSISKSEHGMVTASSTSMYSGGVVTLTVTPEDGYQLAKIIITDSQNKKVEFTGEDGIYSFKMPGQSVTVQAMFVSVGAATPTPVASGAPTPTGPPAPVVSPSPTTTPTPTPSGSSAPAPTISPSPISTPTPVPSYSPTPTESPIPTISPAPELWNNPFTDVSDTGWYIKAIEFVHTHGLMSGYGNGKFGPNDNLTRAQFAQILYNQTGRPDTANSRFNDVKIGQWYTEAVNWAASQGIVCGYGNGKFGPDDPITRQDLALMLWRYDGSPEPRNCKLDFMDAGSTSKYAWKSLCWANENCIISGKPGKVLDPKGRATRAEVAQIIKNHLSKQRE